MAPPRRVLVQVLSAHDALAGGAIHARGIAAGLRRHGVSCAVLCTGGADESPVFDEVIRARPPALPLLWRYEPLGHVPGWLRATACAAEFDAVVSLSSVMSVATRWTAPRVPLVFCPAILDKLEHAGECRPVFRWFETLALRGADGVVVTAHSVLETIRDLYAIEPERAGIAPLGLERDVPRASGRDRAALGVPAGARLLLTIGTLNDNKGQLDIAAALADELADDVWWAVVGDGPARGRLEAALRGTRLGARTILAGNDPNVADWYAASDVFISGSRHETFGLAIGEALDAGVPVVIPRHGADLALSPLAEAVAEQGLGAVYARRDAGDLRAALRPLLESEGLRREMGARARGYARGALCWERYAECLLRLLGGARMADMTAGTPDIGGRTAEVQSCRAT